MVTASAYVTLASSTEGASRLQVLQPGAQNHSTTGFSANASLREKDLPVSVVATTSSEEDELFGSLSSTTKGAVASTSSALESLHADIPMTATHVANRPMTRH